MSPHSAAATPPIGDFLAVTDVANIASKFFTSLVFVALALLAEATAAATIKILWYSYGAPTSQYRQRVSQLAQNAPNYPQSAGLHWDVSFFGPGDPPPNFSTYNVLVIQSGEAWSTGAAIGDPDLIPDFSGILANRAAIAAARGERTLISGSDADFHATRGDSGNCAAFSGCAQFDGAVGYVVNAANWAGSGAGLGVLSFYDGEFPGAFWWANPESFLKDELAGKVNSRVRDNSPGISIEAGKLPLNYGLTSTGLSNWSNSFHATFAADTAGYRGIQNSSAQPGRVLTIVSASFATAAAGPAPLLQLAASSYSVDEQGTSVDVQVTRSGNRIGAVNVNYSTRDGTAVATGDYTLTSGTLTFADGDTIPKTIRIPITDDQANEGAETFTVELSNATDSGKIGAVGAATVIINGNDAPAASGGGGGGGCTFSRTPSADVSLLSLLIGACGTMLARRTRRQKT